MLTLVASMLVTAHAALPPYWESVRQVKAVLDSREVAASFENARSAASVLSVAHAGGSRYTVTAGRCTVQAEVRFGALPPGVAGAAPIVGVTAGRAACR